MMNSTNSIIELITKYLSENDINDLIAREFKYTFKWYIILFCRSHSFSDFEKLWTKV